MSCSSILTTTLSLTGILLSSSSLYITTTLSSDKTFVAPCDLSPTLNCSSFLTTPYSSGLGLVGPLLGNDHQANLPNSVFSIIVFTVIFLANFSSNLSVVTMMLVLSTITSIISSTVVIMSLPMMCPIYLSSLVTTMLMVMTIISKRRSLDSFPTNNINQAFKKLI
eukprot:GFUD01043126.1.p1 GENE.GFUD01043126.1~~GFUD01043126.1.p1  ORF type:complete len:166 (+),score=40.89 GFUD01043126.1:60-557(+)